MIASVADDSSSFLRNTFVNNDRELIEDMKTLRMCEFVLMYFQRSFAWAATIFRRSDGLIKPPREIASTNSSPVFVSLSVAPLLSISTDNGS